MLNTKKETESKVTLLNEQLKHLRDGIKYKRTDCCSKIFYYLGFESNNSVTLFQMDSFLIKMIEEYFGKSKDSDILLMAFGLLKGYEYWNISITERRRKYLNQSNYLESNPRSKVKSFTDATPKEQALAVDAIRTGPEAERIETLAIHLLSLRLDDIKKTIDQFNADSAGKVTLPAPYYLSIKDVGNDKSRPTNTLEVNDNMTRSKTTYNHKGNKINKNHTKNKIKFSTITNVYNHLMTKITNIIIVVEGSSDNKCNDKTWGKSPKTSEKQKLLNRHISLRTMFAAIAVVAFCIGCGILACGYFREKRNNKELLAQIASLNSNGKERDSVIATSIEVENKNINLVPGGHEYLVVKATPPEVDILFDLNYTSEPEGIVTIDKNRDDIYARVTALHVREEDMCDKVTITIQGSGTAGAKAYVFIKSTDSKGISAGNNMDSD